MLLLVEINLMGADLDWFEAYETAVLPLVARHGGEILFRVRTTDRRRERHLLRFPDRAAYERFASDPGRASLNGQKEACGARFEVFEAEEV